MHHPSQSLNTHVAIFGGGLGGVAAALQVCQAGYHCIIIEPTAWLGGQASSQGVSALDEHRYIETFGGSPTYLALRQRIREMMAQRHGIQPRHWETFNPGDAWVSNVCFYPHVAATVMRDMLHPYVEQGLCDIRTGHQVQTVTCVNGQITQATITGDTTFVLTAALYIDATELGDILALAGLDYVVGAESHADTGEHAAPHEARPHEVQGFTYGFAVEYCPGEAHRIAKPEGYAALRDRQPFTLTLHGESGEARPFRVFAEGPTGLPPFWTYRRLWHGQHCTPAQRDIALINWNSNDYHHGRIIDVTEDEVAARLDEAKRLSLAFLYWMQTEMPRDDGTGFGYPELRLVPEIMGTHDGLSMAPYIRESRRTRGLRRIVAEDLLVSHQPAARAKLYADSVGVGWYFMDLHPAPGNPKSMFTPTRPFQIPLGALVPADCQNLLMGNKNIATTHLSNGSYRLHPVEWNIGLAAGECAVLAIASKRTPPAIANDITQIRTLQSRLLAQGQPLAWAVDVPPGSSEFVATQHALIAGVIDDDSPRSQQLEITLDQPLSPVERTRWQALLTPTNHPTTLHAHSTWRDACHAWNMAFLNKH